MCPPTGHGTGAGVTAWAESQTGYDKDNKISAGLWEFNGARNVEGLAWSTAQYILLLLLAFKIVISAK